MATDSVILALEEQVECYRRLAKLAATQHEHVQFGQTEALLSVLQLRQDVLDRIAGLEQVLTPAKRQWREYLATLQPMPRARAEILLGETRSLLEQITAADRNDAIVLQQRKLELGKQISQTSVAKQVNRSYAAAAYGARNPTINLQR